MTIKIRPPSPYYRRKRESTHGILRYLAGLFALLALIALYGLGNALWDEWEEKEKGKAVQELDDRYTGMVERSYHKEREGKR